VDDERDKKGRVWFGDDVEDDTTAAYKFDITSRRSDVFLTGRNRERLTFTPTKAGQQHSEL